MKKYIVSKDNLEEIENIFKTAVGTKYKHKFTNIRDFNISKIKFDVNNIERILLRSGASPSTFSKLNVTDSSVILSNLRYPGNRGFCHIQIGDELFIDNEGFFYLITKTEEYDSYYNKTVYRTKITQYIPIPPKHNICPHCGK